MPGKFPPAHLAVANADRLKVEIYERRFSTKFGKWTSRMKRIRTIEFPRAYGDEDEQRYYFLEAAQSVARMYGPETVLEIIRDIDRPHEVLVLDEEVHWREMHW